MPLLAHRTAALCWRVCGILRLIITVQRHQTIKTVIFFCCYQYCAVIQAKLWQKKAAAKARRLAFGAEI
jgi:hypothetical protein